MILNTKLRIVLVVLMAASCIGAGASNDSDVCAIDKAVVHHMRPAGVKNPPKIFHIAIEDNYAVALWVDGYAGGIAVLRDKSGEWTILKESGGWDNVEGLIRAGVPRKTALRLAKDVGM